MNLVAVLFLAATAARVETVSLTTLDSQLAVRVAVTGRPGMVAVHRESDAARVSIAGADLGVHFAGGRRFAWTPIAGSGADVLAAPVHLDRIEVVGSEAEVSVLLHVPPEVSIEVRRDRRGFLLVFRQMPASGPPAPAPPPKVAAAPSPEPEVAPSPPVEEAPRPPAVTAPVPSNEPPAREASPASRVAAVALEPAPEAKAPATPPAEPVPPPPATAEAPAPAPSSETLELARHLFPGAGAMSPESDSTTRASVDDLYGRLFPGGPPETTPETVVVPPVETLGADEGVPLGPLHVQAGLDVHYVDADTFVETSAAPVRDHYMEVTPRLLATAPVREGRLQVDYLPTLRALATYADVNSSSHRLGVGIDLPVGPSVLLRAKDSFVSGVLDTRDVDPGGEYFFDLARFNRNTVDGGASIVVGPRLSLELGGTLNTVRFKDPSSFFDYDTRLASAGLGYELTPNLKAIAAFVYDQVPTPLDRPEAEARARSGQVTLAGTILPLVSGSVSFGYRDQTSPNAGAGGTGYRGLVMSGSVSRQLGPDSTVTLFLNRSTPVSAFEENAFYVTTGLQGAARLPLPAALQLQAGLGYQWNDYRVVTEAIGEPRADRIFALYVGLRRPIRRQLFVSANYRREQRRSNLDQFDTNTDGFFLQLEWNIFGNPPRRLPGLLLATPILLLLAQASPAAPASSIPSASAEVPYRVGSGDVLEVIVRNEPDLSRLPTVQTTGAVFLPRAGEVRVAGLTTAEIADRISSRLAAPGEPLPDVSVRVKEYQSQFVWVRGEVFHPGRKPLREGTRLVDALLDAGGFTSRSSGEVTVERKAGTFSDGSHAQMFRFEGGDPSPAEMQDLGVRLQSGDQVFVATQHWVSVGGEVARPGRYPLEEGMTVSRLVESAGGLSRFASQKVTLRQGGGAPDGETEVDLKAVRDGEAKDPVLTPGDQVVVPARRL